MKNFSLPRLAVSVWFFFFSLSSVISYMFSSNRHDIFGSIVAASVLTGVFLVGFSWIDEKF